MKFQDDPAPTNCGKFKAAISFKENPDDQYRFQVLLDDCSTLATCQTGSQMEGATNFTFDGAPGCPCVTPSAQPPSPTQDGVHLCLDYTSTVRIRVFRKPGAPATCATYVLSVTNG